MAPDASDHTWRIIGHIKVDGEILGAKITFGEGQPTPHEIHARLGEIAAAIQLSIEGKFMADPGAVVIEEETTG